MDRQYRLDSKAGGRANDAQGQRAARLAAAALMGVLLAGPDAWSQPNILMIYVDDLVYDGLGVTGHNFVETPNLDSIGQNGAVFTNSFVTTPMCSPGRASMLTGQFAATTGVYYNDQSNAVSDNDLPTYQKELQANGYRTAWVGKWHMDHFLHARDGFDYWASYHGQGNHDNVTMGIQEDGVYFEQNSSAEAPWTKTAVTNYALGFLDDFGTGGTRSEPFAMTLSFKATHAPFGDGETASGGDYANETIIRPENASLAYGGYNINTEKPVYTANGAPLTQPNDTQGNTTQQSQMEMMKDVDVEVGRVLNALDQQDLLDDTMIIFTSDNGFFLGEHGKGDKRLPYEESIRVPLLISGPGVVPGQTPDGMVANIDLAPTILTAAGIPVPNTVQGVALNDVLAGNSTATRDSLFFEYNNEYKFDWAPEWDAVRTDTHYYVTYSDFGEQYDELYDLVNDPGQLNNLLVGPEASLPETQTLLTQLKAELDVVRDEATYGVNNFDRTVHDLGTLDFAVAENGSISSTTGTISRAGANGTGSSAVIAYEIPTLADGLTLERAFVSFFVAGRVGDTSSITGDLWAIGITDDPTLLAEYLESDTELAQADRADNLKLQEDILDGANNNGRNFSDEAAAELLAGYLTDFYEANPGYSGGSYLQVRLNSDTDLGSANRGWDIYTTENLQSGNPFYFRFPSLVLDTTGVASLVGDLNQDGVLDSTDIDLFAFGWKSDTTGLTEDEQTMLGDVNHDNITDLKDWFLIRESFSSEGVALSSDALFSATPEPASVASLAIALAALAGRRRDRRPVVTRPSIGATSTPMRIHP